MLGIALGGLINLLDPEYVIVGGGLSAAGDLLMDPAKEVLRSQALCASAGLPAIRFSPLSLTQVGALGAASSVMLNYLEAA
jgi:glucokinase